MVKETLSLLLLKSQTPKVQCMYRWIWAKDCKDYQKEPGCTYFALDEDNIPNTQDREGQQSHFKFTKGENV